MCFICGCACVLIMHLGCFYAAVVVCVHERVHVNYILILSQQ